MTPAAPIDVVIPYFDDPGRLLSILLALAAQVDPATDAAVRPASIVVADDCSPTPPQIDGFDVDLVRLDEPGFHAGTARNVGAAIGDAPIIAFLDGDTVPDPHYLSRLVAPIERGDADLTTGRRRHADLSGLEPSDVAAFVADPDPARLLGEPQWLADGLDRTDRLRSSSSQVYQYVISAVLAVRRSTFDDVGGFDPRFDSYGGEDWELAHRVWNAGWDLEHVADAIAFHDGPDVEGRTVDTEVKTVESLRVMNWIPSSATRLVGVRYEVPDLDVSVHLGRGDLRTNAMSVMSILSSHPGDLVVRLHGFDDDVALLSRLVHDDRIIDRGVPVAAGTRCLVDLSAPVVLAPGALHRLTRDVADGSVGSRIVRRDGVTVRATSRRLVRRALRRQRSVDDVVMGADGLFDEVVDLAGWARAQPGGE